MFRLCWPPHTYFRRTPPTPHWHWVARLRRWTHTHRQLILSLQTENKVNSTARENSYRIFVHTTCLERRPKGCAKVEPEPSERSGAVFNASSAIIANTSGKLDRSEWSAPALSHPVSVNVTLRCMCVKRAWCMELSPREISSGRLLHLRDHLYRPQASAVGRYG